MNNIETHLLITHLPIFGSILGVLVLIYGLLTFSRHTQMAAYWLFIISAASAVFAYLSGNDVGRDIENMKGISQYSILEHTNFANYSMIVLFILGSISIYALWLSANESPFVTKVIPLVLGIALISFTFVIRTGYLGAQIRHNDVRSAPIIEVPTVLFKKNHLVSHSNN
jgi:uncharacterized membrane protein